MAPKKKLQTYIDASLFNELEKLARHQGTSVSMQAALILETSLRSGARTQVERDIADLQSRVRTLEAKAHSPKTKTDAARLSSPKGFKGK